MPPPAGRVAGFDVARAVALFGMIVFHFALVAAADLERPGWLAALVGLCDGRAAALFVTLAGVGLTLLANSPAGPAAARRVLVRRAAVLLLLGFLNLTVWPGDILRVYGVGLAVAAFCLTAPDRRLLALAAAFVLGFLVLLGLVPFETNWDFATLEYRNLWTPAGLVRNLFYDGFRSVFPWCGFLFLGMWVGRRDLLDRRTNTRFLVGGLAAVGLAAVLSRLLLRHFTAHPGEMKPDEVQAVFGLDSLPPLPLFLLAAGGTAVATIAAAVRLTTAVPARLTEPVAAAGRLALTWYLTHIVVGLGGVVAAGWVHNQPLEVAVGLGAGFWLAAVGLSWVWTRRFRHGPLEGLLRAVAG